MALTLSIVPGFASTSAIAGQNVTFMATVTNSGAASVTLSSLWVYGDASISANVGQPSYLTPNLPVGVGNPTLAAGSTYSFPFEVVFGSPNFAGPSPQSPGLSGGVGGAANPVDSSFLLTLQSLSSDSTVASASLLVPVLSAIAPFPLAQGGAAQFSSGFNAVNFLTSFA